MGKDLKGRELGAGFGQRSNGSYYASYVDRFGSRKFLYDRNLAKLKKKYAVAVSDNVNKRSARESITLDDWYRLWFKVYKAKSVRPNTLREYDHIYHKCIAPYYGGYKIQNLTKTDMQRLIDIAYEHGYKYERQNKIKVLMTDMLRRAYEDEYIARNPATGVVLRSKKEKQCRALTLEEQSLFFDFCKNTFYENLFVVAVNTGLRPGELFALTESDINFKKGFIDVNKTLVYQKYLGEDRKNFHVEDPKTKNSYRKVPINSICLEALHAQIELKHNVANRMAKEQNDNLFVTKYNTRLNSQIANDAISRILQSINLQRSVEEQIPRFSMHTLRHTFATRCFEQGISEKVVQSYLGHFSITMTMDTYTHVTENVSMTEIEKIVPGSNSDILECKREHE